MSIKNEFTLLKNDINTGKTKIATAITEKGVQTASNATMETMAANIKKIQQGGGGSTEKPISELIMPTPKQFQTIEGNAHYIRYYNHEQRNEEYYLFPDGFMNSVNIYDANFSKYGRISKYNGGYEVLEKIEMVPYDINNNEYTAIFVVDNNYNLYAGYSYSSYIPNDQFKYSDCETNNNGLTNLTNIKHLFPIKTVGMAFVTDENGKGYFIFPMGTTEYSCGYVYKSIDDLVGESVDFTNFNNSYDGLASGSNELQTDFCPVQYVHDDGYGDQIILVNDTNIYTFDYSIVGQYDKDNYNNFITFNNKITCNDSIHSYGIDFPYLYASSRHTNNYSVDLTNNYGSMQTISGMYGTNLKYTRIDDNFYSVRNGYLFLLQNGDKVSFKNDSGPNLIENAIRYAIGEGKNIWRFVDIYQIVISKYVVDAFNIYACISNSSGLTFNKTAVVNKHGELLIINSGILYKLEKDPKVTI